MLEFFEFLLSNFVAAFPSGEAAIFCDTISGHFAHGGGGYGFRSRMPFVPVAGRRKLIGDPSCA